MQREGSLRSRYLDDSCSDDPALEEEVLRLLAAHEEPGTLQRPAVDLRDLAEPAADPRLGISFGQFEVLETIGQGGMGKVYLARDRRLNRQVALKFPGTDLAADPVAQRRLLREAQSAAGLDHPFVCSIFEASESDDGSLFIAMEYVRGMTLKQRLAQGPPPLWQGLKWARELAEALQAAHQRRLVHRDLKPANVMITETDHVKVMDFGLAKPFGSDREDAAGDLTRTGVRLGTPAYMAPEQLQGRELDSRCDLFALGLILYELFSGRHPFRRSSPIETAVAILGQPAPPLSETAPHLPPLLEQTVAELLEKDPRRRCPSAVVVAQRLETLRDTASQADLPASSPEPTALSADLPPVAARRPWLWASAGLLAVLLVVAALPAPREAALSFLNRLGGPALNLPATPHRWSRRGLQLLERYDQRGHVDEANRGLPERTGAGRELRAGLRRAGGSIPLAVPRRA